MSMETDLAEYLEYLCSENKDISSIIIVSNEGLPIAITGSSDQTLVSGMCTALKCIGKELVNETLDSELKRILVDCSNGVILIQPLNQKAILVVSCRDAAVLSEIDVSSIQMHFSAQHDHLVAS
jgi:predicted regulator of Ras-like GTPase activity (Roadblock/LC7/MglB family)